MKTEEIAKKLVEHFDNKGFTQVQIADELNVSKAYVNSLFTGRRPFGKKQADIWERHFGISKSWLLTGEGDMLKTTKASSATPEPALNFVKVRKLDISPTATFTEFAQTPPELYDYTFVLPLPGEEIDQKDDVVFTIHGESMEPQIPDRSQVLGKLIRPSQWHWAKGVVIVSYDDAFVIKRIKNNRLDSDSFLELESDNPIFFQVVKVPLSSIRIMFHADRIVNLPIH